MNMTQKISLFSSVVFAALGTIYGLIVGANYFVAFSCLGALLGSVVGIIASVKCLVSNRKNCVGGLALVCNFVLLVVIAKELQLIG